MGDPTVAWLEGETIGDISHGVGSTTGDHSKTTSFLVGKKNLANMCVCVLVCDFQQNDDLALGNLSNGIPKSDVFKEN